MSTRLDRCAPTATKTASKAPARRSASRSSTRWPCSKMTPRSRIRLDLGVEHVAGQPVGGDAVPHHPAGLGPVVTDHDLVAATGEVVGGGQPARPGADDEHPPAGALGRPLEAPAALDGEVTEVALHGVHRHRTVELGPVADGLARVVADPPVDGGHRVVVGERPPGLLLAPVLDQGEPGLDVLARGAAGVARREQVEVDGALLPHRARAGPPEADGGEGGQVALWSGHVRLSRSAPTAAGPPEYYAS